MVSICVLYSICVVYNTMTKDIELFRIYLKVSKLFIQNMILKIGRKSRISSVNREITWERIPYSRGRLVDTFLRFWILTGFTLNKHGLEMPTLKFSCNGHGKSFILALYIIWPKFKSYSWLTFKILSCFRIARTLSFLSRLYTNLKYLLHTDCSLCKITLFPLNLEEAHVVQQYWICVCIRE